MTKKLRKTPSKHSGIDIFKRGRAIEKEAYIEREKSNQHKYRIGNTGFVIEDEGRKLYAGNCPRVSLLRKLGLQHSVTEDSTLNIFEAGYANEYMWENYVKKGWPGNVMTGNEGEQEWDIGKGIIVKGTPDVLFCDENDKPIAGLELKCVVSTSKAVKVLFKGPTVQNLAQAGHYSMRLGIPFNLIYSSRVLGAPAYAAKQETGIGWVKNAFNLEFKLYWLGDLLAYKGEDGLENITYISSKGIDEFYQYTEKCLQEKAIPDRIANLDHMKKPLGYSPCQYCDFSKACDKTEKQGYDAWIESVKYYKNLAEIGANE
jgi:hypothetical protein